MISTFFREQAIGVFYQLWKIGSIWDISGGLHHTKALGTIPVMDGDMVKGYTTLTEAQKTHFDVFSFLVLWGAFSVEEMQRIDCKYDEIMTEALPRQGVNYEEVRGLSRKFVIDPGFAEKRPALNALLDDTRINLTLEGLLGQGFYYTGSDGSLRVGDTLWHPDQGWDPSIPKGRDDPGFAAARGHYYPGVKVAFYLDPPVKDRGCLSIIPGSHCSPLHEALWSLHCDIPERGPQLVAQPGVNQFGIFPNEIPCFPVETQPGDVVFFSHQTWHASLTDC